MSEANLAFGWHGDCINPDRITSDLLSKDLDNVL